MNKTPSRWVLLCLGLLLVLHLLLLGFFQVSSLDTWFHLKEGELYVTTGSLPAHDPFAFTSGGREWIKYSWLADVLFYLVYAGAGFPGLVLLRLVFLFATAWFLYHLLRQCHLNPVAAILLVFMVSLSLRFRLFIRPELITFVLLLGTLAILLRLPSAAWWMPYTLLPLFVVWVNIHGSYVFGLGLPGLVLLANLLVGGGAAPGWGRLQLDPVRRRHLALAVMSLPLAGMLNPQGISVLLFPFRQNRMVRLTAFPEWMEAWRYPEVDPVWWEPVVILAVVIVAFAVVAGLLIAWERHWDPVGVGIVLAMGTYAVFRNRAIPYFVLAATPFLALSLARAAEHLPTRYAGRSPRRLMHIGVMACLVLFISSIVDQTFLTRRFAPGFGVAAHVFPEHAAAFLERHQIDGRIFNSYQFGGYLMWRRWPANQVFIDGRYDAILFDEGLLEEYFRAHRDPAVLERLAAKYGIEVLVLDADPERRIGYLTSPSSWARVYWDPVAEVFVRRNDRYAAFIAAHDYVLTRSEEDLSYLAAYRQDVEVWNRALAELRRAVRDNPRNELAWQGLAQEYGAAGAAVSEQRLDALNHAIDVLVGNPATGKLHAARAETLLQLGMSEEARVAALRALQLDGDLLLPRWVLASVAEQRGAWAEAQDQFRKLLPLLEPDDPRIPVVRGRLGAIERRLRERTDR